MVLGYVSQFGNARIPVDNYRNGVCSLMMMVTKMCIDENTNFPKNDNNQVQNGVISLQIFRMTTQFVPYRWQSSGLCSSHPDVSSRVLLPKLIENDKNENL